MINDPFRNSSDSPSAPAEYCFDIVPDDGADLPRATKALYVGQAGDITLRSIRGDADVLFRALPAGTILDVRTRAVRATGTTAAGIVGLA